MNTPFLKLVAEDIKTRFGNDLSQVAIIFNNKRPITYLKKHLADIYQQALWSPQFYTIQDFFKQSTNALEASPLTQFFYLYDLHNQMLSAEGLEGETFEEFYPIAEIILADFGQLDYELVRIEEIYAELYDSTKIDIAFEHLTHEQKGFIRQFWQSFSAEGHNAVQERFLRLWRRLPALYRTFKAKIAEQKQFTFPALYRDLAENKAAKPAFVDKYNKILFVGFNALNKAETQLFQRWQQENRALFYFDADAYYLYDNQQEAGRFIRQNINQHELINALGDPANVIANRNVPVHLYAASGKNSQTKLLYEKLVGIESKIPIQSSGVQETIGETTPAKTTAILLADESLLVPLLQSLPDLKVNITTGYPLNQSPIYGLLDLWLEIQADISHLRRKKITFQQLERFLNHPMTQIPSTERMTQLQSIAEKQQFEIPLIEIQIERSAVPRFFRPLQESSELISEMILLINYLLDAMALKDHASQIDSNLLVETKKVLNQLQLGLDRVRTTSIPFQIGLIRKAIAPVSAAIEGDPLDGVQIMGLLESRCLNFDHVFILGTNEGVLPKTSNTPSFLPTSLRQAYGLPIIENQDALSAYLFYRHFQFSTDIHIFYNSLIDENSTGEESRFVKQLEFESNFQFVTHHQQQPIQFPQKNEELTIPKQGAIWQQLQQSFLQQGERISASALTTYLHSPLQFFFKYVAKIKEPPTISQEFEMNKLGTVIHNVMEKILSPFKDLDGFIDTQSLSSCLHKTDELVIHEINEIYQNEGDGAVMSSLQRIMHKIASEYVNMFIQYDIDNYKKFKIVELESNYTIEFPIHVLGKPATVNLLGIIDRVDIVITHSGDQKTRIVDYKTGGDSVFFDNLDKVFAPNTSNKALVQTLFYANVLETSTGKHDLEPHLYVSRKMREEGTLFHSKNEALEKEALAITKERFLSFLRETLEELFDPSIPFKHNAQSKIYPSDPYTLFYRNALAERDDD
ncbi:PD-(D/E)XK nuclease family protein [Sphingobacterium sp. JB170]|uniref:PD-(D/E)XK nuclease family protein n=1 Tax=Sphingobacterium sp. JB170 TaxID=1434842 RepID=UPI00097F3CF4|nr:PD-(D/E)XK nuclease family protein [Sphingobacterium sp. JB170]SJN50189.1 hypothetical protein FM107_20030 [Sphingobacterium sp. JB170]